MNATTTTEREEAFLDYQGHPVTAVVYWDTADPANVGLAYRITWDEPGPRAGLEESGPCDTANPWTEVYEFLGPKAAYSDGTPLPPFAD